MSQTTVKLVKAPKTIAEKSGIKSVKSVEKEIAKVNKAEAKAEAKATVLKDKESKLDMKRIHDTLDALSTKVSAIPTSSGVEKAPRKKRILTDEQKDVLRQRLIHAREVRMSKKVAIVA